ncbi:beta-N-acetylhexosaminidase [Natronocella acetinitrilica]|uniref:Beta-hexosaminidase n=1 Tax=Natronocella acetinitrilica TaxID=414046 RepID=A0AAE3G790_9GAMM|nr:beta-N-acetylhexosaminidase [Natronocella acetinitrilica]MCP1676076.1 beta-N-acetylhexosaminidase [Natronocella acetinitrilica]
MFEEQQLGPLIVGLQGTQLTGAERRLLQHPAVGGVILFARNIETPAQIRALTESIRGLRSPALLVSVDQEGGRVQRCREGFTRLPPAGYFGERYRQSADAGLALARAAGLVMAAELRRVGIDYSFAPVLDLDLGLSSVIGDRAFHSDPEAVAALAGAWIDGMHAAGMPCTGKHFPGHGGVMPDSHLDLPVDQRSLAELERADLVPYARLIEAGKLDCAMTAHIVFPALDRLPASFSEVWMNQVLRGQLGFKGLIVADDLGMEGAAVVGDLPERATRALSAGADMVMVCNELDAMADVIAALARAPANASAMARRQRLRDAVTSAPPASEEALARALLRE